MLLAWWRDVRVSFQIYVSYYIIAECTACPWNDSYDTHSEIQPKVKWFVVTSHCTTVVLI